MARLEKVQTSLIKGILSPRIRGRLDFQGFFDGADSIENMFVLPQGGGTRRSGTRFVAETKDSTKLSRLVNFQFSVDQTYEIEFGEFYTRFYSNESRLLATTVTAAITNGFFGTDIAGWTDLSTGTGSIAHDAVRLGMTMDVGGTPASAVAIAEQSVTINEASTNHFLRFSHRFRNDSGKDAALEVRIGTASGLTDIFQRTGMKEGSHIIKFNPGATSPVFIQYRFASPDGTTAGESVLLDNVEFLSNVPLELLTPYTEAQLASLGWTQSADILFVAQAGVTPFEIRRFSADEFSFQVHDYQDGPYPAENDTPTTLVLGATTGITTLTASATAGINGGAGFLSTDVGRLFRIATSGSTDTWGQIIDFTNSTVVIIKIRDPGAILVTKRWRLGSWFTTSSNYPQINTFHEQRLFWGRSTFLPQNVWGSKTEDFDSHEPNNLSDLTVADDNALNITIASNRVNAIVWFSSGDQGLLVGTAGSEALIRPAGTTKGLTPDNTEVRVQTVYGSKANIKPDLIGRTVLFVQRDGREIRDAQFDFTIEGFSNASVSVLAENLFRIGVKRIVFTQAPVPIVWSMQEDGKLAGLTLEQQQQVGAWHTHPIGGTAVVVEDISTIVQGQEDQLWMIVKRTINGATFRSVEFVETLFEEETAIADAYFVDAGLTGPTTQTEEITNGAFTVDLSGWTVAAGTVVQLAGEASFSASSQLDQIVTTILPGKSHILTFDVSAATGFNLLVTESGGATILATATNMTPGSQSFVFTPTLATYTVSFTTDAGGSALLDNVSSKTVNSFLTGLTHLVGETVQILLDGATHPNRVVDVGGAIELDTGRSATTAHAGLKQGPNGAFVQLLPFESGIEGFTTVGKIKRVHQLIARLLATVGLKAGVKGAPETVPFRDGDPMNQALQPFTGTKRIPIAARHDLDNDIVFQNDQPLPFHLISTVIELEVHES